MRNGHQNNKHQHQHHRMRGRNRGNGKNHNPLTRVYESNGPDVKIRGTANHIAEKYIQLARDATASGDPVAAENYYQHAEHYFRLIATAQEQLRQNQPFQQQRPDGGEVRQDDNYGDGDDDSQPQFAGEPHTPRDQQQTYSQPYQREQQPYQPRDRDQQPRQENRQPQENRMQTADVAPDGNDVDRLPSFITGGQQPGNGQPQNGHDNQGDRFPLHRRRRRGHRGPRSDMAGGAQGDAPDDSAPAGE
jgi:hypothetical protein